MERVIAKVLWTGHWQHLLHRERRKIRRALVNFCITSNLGRMYKCFVKRKIILKFNPGIVLEKRGLEGSLNFKIPLRNI